MYVFLSVTTLVAAIRLTAERNKSAACLRHGRGLTQALRNSNPEKIRGNRRLTKPQISCCGAPCAPPTSTGFRPEARDAATERCMALWPAHPLSAAARRRSLLPRLRRERQFVQLGPRNLPGWIVFVQQRDETLAVRRLDEVRHLVDHDVLQEVLRLLH